MQFRLAGFVFLLPLAVFSQSSSAPVVRFHTNLGDIDVQLLPNAAPQTVANFIGYMNAGAYTNSVIHRSVPNFIWQGGGYQLINHMLVTIPAKAPISNEFSVSNTQGTLAMALVGSDINSATTQWFFNEVDNSSTLDSQSFTVFGRITDTASMNVMEAIAGVPVPNPSPLASPFDQIPLLNYNGGPVQDSNYVLVYSISELGATPAISSGGVISATAFGGYPAAAPGSFIEIYGSNLSNTTRGWAQSDFTRNQAPTSLDGVTVTIGGQSAYVYYVSPTQVDVQVPANVTTDGQADVAVSIGGQSSPSVPLGMRPFEGGLLAPSSFNIGGKQYAAAQHASTGAFVSNGTIPGIAAAPAVAGETLQFYGIGFGPVSPSTIPVAGQIVQQANSLVNQVQFTIGGSSAQVAYAGLVQGLVGLYQFNVVVPSSLSSGDQQVKVTLTSPDAMQIVPQTLYLSVQ